ncbi:MAG: DNA-deoxyinosine glycosylase [Xanthomonadales bacterium]|nr:DNA-deoxyinosine glycosylase [Xanthomonadales bacterium]
MTARSSNNPCVKSFPAQVAGDCRVLILGSAPSTLSLTLQQVYAHPRNLFWPLMGEMFGATRDLAYTRRIACLHARGVGIWDVLRQCERKGSLDSAIIRDSEIPNPIAELLACVPSIRAIAFNGAHAGRVFRRRVLPRIESARSSELALLDLPSTSPAHAAMSHREKAERWRVLLDICS